MADTSFWDCFRTLNARRRAVRHFSNEPVTDEELEAVLREAQLAPSSNNAQPYTFVCARSPAAKAEVARYCRDQRAAASAAALIVQVCGRGYARQTLQSFADHLDTSERDQKSRAYHRKQLKKARLFLAIGSWPIWAPLVALITLFRPGAALLPLGANGVKHWCVRSSLFAAQNLMLAASAAGLDTCPMEGVDPMGLARHLKLGRDCVIPVVIAVGHRAENARVEERWRKPFALTAQFL
jgi:nitroreductase